MTSGLTTKTSSVSKNGLDDMVVGLMVRPQARLVIIPVMAPAAGPASTPMSTVATESR